MTIQNPLFRNKIHFSVFVLYKSFNGGLAVSRSFLTNILIDCLLWRFVAIPQCVMDHVSCIRFDRNVAPSFRRKRFSGIKASVCLSLRNIL